MRRKKPWSVLHVGHSGTELIFRHGRNYVFDLYSNDVGVGGAVVVLRDGNKYDTGVVTASDGEKGGMLFVGLEKIIPYDLKVETRPGKNLLYARLKKVTLPVRRLEALWFKSGDVIRLQVSAQKLRIALDRPF
jgi:hypothetical protein